MGNAHPNTVPYQDFPTADGHMILAVGNDGQFARFCQAAARAEWAADARFATHAARVNNRVVLIALMRELTVARSPREWVALLESVGVPCGPINTIADVFDDPQVKARGMQIQMDHAAADHVALVASPIRMSDTPVQYRHAPPLLGQHTREVLGQMLELKEDTMDLLFEKGVLAWARWIPLTRRAFRRLTEQ